MNIPVTIPATLDDTSNIVFVSSLIHIKPHKTIDDYIDNINDLVLTGIHLILNISTEFFKNKELIQFIKTAPSNLIVSWIDISLLWTHSICQLPDKRNLELPDKRNLEKDTEPYLVYLLSKMEILSSIIQEDSNRNYYTGSQLPTHYAWIDCDISQLFHLKKQTLEYLKILSQRTLTPNCGVNIPGFSNPFKFVDDKTDKENESSNNNQPIKDSNKTINDDNTGYNPITNSIYWRFCGCFFIGDKQSIISFCDIFRQQLPPFLEKTGKLVWDVNFWAYLESVCDEFAPICYKANHDDSIITGLSPDLFTIKLSGLESYQSVKYDYPEIEKYYPTSASYIFYNGKHIINTRYVDYWLYPNGYYKFNNPEHIIHNKNFVSELDPVTMLPLYYEEMMETDIGLSRLANCFSQGLEDIRLYIDGSGDLRFIATTANYSPNGCNQMCVGKYDMESRRFLDGRILKQPPEFYGTDTVLQKYEKNWIPICFYENNIADSFIYKWGSLGNDLCICSDNGKIIKRHSVFNPLFNKLKGSTIFIDYKNSKSMESSEYLIGLVHISEDGEPRHYSHLLVLLDKTDLKPLKYSELFCFETVGIEFCIGFTIMRDEYLFWISRHDREPLLIRIKMTEIPLLFNI